MQYVDPVVADLETVHATAHSDVLLRRSPPHAMTGAAHFVAIYDHLPAACQVDTRGEGEVSHVVLNEDAFGFADTDAKVFTVHNTQVRHHNVALAVNVHHPTEWTLRTLAAVNRSRLPRIRGKRNRAAWRPRMARTQHPRVDAFHKVDSVTGPGAVGSLGSALPGLCFGAGVGVVSVRRNVIGARSSDSRRQRPHEQDTGQQGDAGA